MNPRPHTVIGSMIAKSKFRDFMAWKTSLLRRKLSQPKEMALQNQRSIWKQERDYCRATGYCTFQAFFECISILHKSLIFSSNGTFLRFVSSSWSTKTTSRVTLTPSWFLLASSTIGTRNVWNPLATVIQTPFLLTTLCPASVKVSARLAIKLVWLPANAGEWTRMLKEAEVLISWRMIRNTNILISVVLMSFSSQDDLLLLERMTNGTGCYLLDFSVNLQWQKSVPAGKNDQNTRVHLLASNQLAVTPVSGMTNQQKCALLEQKLKSWNNSFIQQWNDQYS